MNKAVIDIETGGYNKEKNGLCEIGIIAIDEHHNEIDSLSVLIKPYERETHLQEFEGQLVSYKDQAMEVNGLTVDQLLKDGVEPEEACAMIDYFLESNHVESFIGQNIDRFDRPWLAYFFGRFFQPSPIMFDETECTMKIAKEQLDLKSYSLEALCNHFDIVNEESHRAVGDCRATLEIYKRLI